MRAPRTWFLGHRRPRVKPGSPPSPGPVTDFTGNAQADAEAIARHLGRPGDLQRRLLPLSPGPGRSSRTLLVLYLDNLVNVARLERAVVLPLLEGPPGALDRPDGLLGVIAAAHVRLVSTVPDAATRLIHGWVMVLGDGWPQAAGIELPDWPGRAVDEPPSEVVTKGPRTGFVEELRKNLALLRVTFPTPNLRVQLFSCGKEPGISVAMVWMEGRTPPERVERGRILLGRLHDILGPVDIQTVSELVGRTTMRVLPLFFQTERVDRVAAALREGRIAIFVDRSPFALVAPSTFFMMLTSAEDYYQPPEVALALRLTRMVGFLLALVATPFYIGLVGFNPGVLPTRLAMAVSASRQGVPYPAWMEALIMELMMTILVEASVRLPRAIGSAATVVGGLIIGQAAAQASLISNLMIIVVAVSAITSFALPNVEILYAVRVMKWPMMLAAGLMGLPGLFVAFVLMTMWMASLRSLDEPYLYPMAPFEGIAVLRDTLLRRRWEILHPGRYRPQVPPFDAAPTRPASGEVTP
ncbi:spore germination protein [Carboxydochorda subterranea]|uniref:Spore germination protein n=1 Tax=Carboxydichorda subterranea TaxID=3109565 RepID=A0ABZ1C180_9FIRM|nr:spore germination protein [Limnochorda sp. L945t]WRP18782.1 spore germination protein [Limnochorda sp. L945t]